MNLGHSLVERYQQLTRRRLRAPEVVQTSAMDCGPAALKCLLEGFHIPASYGRLREACQTSVDGTSIETVEAVAQQLGLDVEQVMLPKDYLWVPAAGALPAIAVVSHASGATHFVVIWRRYGRWLEVMDPAVGRRWVTCERFEHELFPHGVSVAATDWYEWASSEETQAIFLARLRTLGATAGDASVFVEQATAPSGWQSLAALDAAIRMLGVLIHAGGLTPGTEALDLLRSVLAKAQREVPGRSTAIPSNYWSVVPQDEDPEQLALRGIVLLRVRGRNPEVSGDATTLTPELAAALAERPINAARELWRLVRSEGLLTPIAMAGAVALAVGALLIEALLFRGLFDIAGNLNVASQRVAALVALLVFAALLLSFELPIVSEALRMGRHLETRLRTLLLQKLPRLNDRYFQSRPVSDLAERSHSIYLVRSLPDLAIRGVRTGCELLLTLAGIAFLDGEAFVLMVVMVIVASAIIVLAQPLLSERDMRARNHAGALQVFYLDAMLGSVPIRTHSAERAVQREHEALLSQWARSAKRVIVLSLTVSGMQAFVCASLAGWLLLRHVATNGIDGSLLLLVYWVLKLPALGEALASLAAQYPTYKNTTLRLLELTNAPEEPPTFTAAVERSLSGASGQPTGGVAIDFKDVTVVAAGHTILQNVNVAIRRGEHVAIVGASGAGKSSLLGLLLGWHRPVAGVVRVDDEAFTAERREQLHTQTAWVDPAVQLWNRSLLENLRYSSQAGDASQLTSLLEDADLTTVLSRLPEGLQSSLAEGGVRLSGGEGQRVRLARAMWQQGVRLALLDEPFRGLDRGQRRRHLAQVRRLWQHATLLCVTHDVSETQGFDRVLVVNAGQIVEDAAPEVLASSPDSLYRRLLDTEESLRDALWNADLWRRLRLDSGQLQESSLPRQELVRT
jgi:ATP-binding cassette subfamily B protein